MGRPAALGSPDDIATYAGFADFRTSYHGLARSWDKRAAG